MGQFSWLDCITEEQVLDDVRRDVYVLVPQKFGGGHIKEECYDGYGRFGGNDIYELVVDWNIGDIEEVLAQADNWACDWLKDYKEQFRRLAKGEDIEVEKRLLGIVLACYDEDNVRLRYPIKITHSEDAEYEYCAPSMTDPDQGWEQGVVPVDDDEDEWY